MEKKPVQQQQSDANDAVAALTQMRALLVANGGDKTEGIFRVSANQGLQEKAFAAFKRGDFSPSVTDDPHVVAMSIKQWCRTCGMAPPPVAGAAASSASSKRPPVSSGSRFLRPVATRPARLSNPTRRKSNLDRKSILDRVSPNNPFRRHRRHASSDTTDLVPPSRGSVSLASSASASRSSMDLSVSESESFASSTDSGHSEAGEPHSNGGGSSGGGGVAMVAGKCVLHEVDLDSVAKLPPGDVDTLESILGVVSPVNRDTYNVVVDICADIAANEFLTRMSPKNLAIVFAPNLFDYDGVHLTGDILRLNMVMRACQQFMELCIQTHMSERSAEGVRARESAHFPQPAAQQSLSPRAGASSRSPELPSPVKVPVSLTSFSRRIVAEDEGADDDADAGESSNMSLTDFLATPPRARSQQNTPSPTMQKVRAQTVAKRRSKTMRKLQLRRALSLVSPPSSHSKESLEKIDERSNSRSKTRNSHSLSLSRKNRSISPTPTHTSDISQPGTSSAESPNFRSFREKFSAMSKNKTTATPEPLSSPTPTPIVPPVPPRLPQRSFVAPSKPSHMPTVPNGSSSGASKSSSTSAPPRTVAPSLLNPKSSRKSRPNRSRLDSQDSVEGDPTDRLDAKANEHADSDADKRNRRRRVLATAAGIKVSASHRLKALSRVKSSPLPTIDRDMHMPADALPRQTGTRRPRATEAESAAGASRRRKSLPSILPPDSESWKMVSIYVAALQSLSKKHEGAHAELARCRAELAATKRQLEEQQQQQRTPSPHVANSKLSSPQVASSDSHSSPQVASSDSQSSPQVANSDSWSSRSSIASADEGHLLEEKISGNRRRSRRRPHSDEGGVGDEDGGNSRSAAAETADQGSQTDLSSLDGSMLANRTGRHSPHPKGSRTGGRAAAASPHRRRLLALITVGVFVGFSFLRLRRCFTHEPNHHAW